MNNLRKSSSSSIVGGGTCSGAKSSNAGYSDLQRDTRSEMSVGSRVDCRLFSRGRTSTDLRSGRTMSRVRSSTSGLEETPGMRSAL